MIGVLFGISVFVESVDVNLESSGSPKIEMMLINAADEVISDSKIDIIDSDIYNSLEYKIEFNREVLLASTFGEILANNFTEVFPFLFLEY